MATSTRDRLLHTAQNLFYRDGFHAVGLDRILNEVGVTKTTFYNHFESKEQLVLEVLLHHDRWWRDTFQKMLRQMGGDTPEGQLRAVPDVLHDLLNSENFNGCIFVNVAAEFPIPTDPIHEAAAEHKHLMEMILRDLALRAGASDPVALAQELSLLMEGAFVTRQVSGNEQSTDIARRLGKLLFDKYLPQSPVPAPVS